MQAIKENARQATLQKLDGNLAQELKRGRRRAQYALNRSMRNSSNHPAKPIGTAGHHIVASTDPRADRALRILRIYDIDPNDEANGVNLPRYARHVPHSAMPKAIAHSQTHTAIYHQNIFVTLMLVDVPGMTREGIVKALRYIASDLRAGTFPIHEAIEV